MNKIEANMLTLPLWTKNLLDLPNNQPVLILNADYRIIYINDPAKKIFEITKSINYQVSFFETIKNVDIQDILKYIKASKKERSAQYFIKIIKSRSFTVALNPFFEGNITEGFSLTFNDTTIALQKERENTLLYQVANNLNQKLPKEDVLKNLLSNIIYTMDLDNSSIHLLNQDGLQLHNVEKPSKISFVKNKGAVWLSIKTAQPICILDTKKDRRYKTTNKDEESKSILVLPLKNKEKIFGTICLEKGPGQYFPESERQLFQSVSSRIASFLENEELLNELRFEKERLAAIISHSADGMISLDIEGKVKSWNNAMEKLTGFSQDNTIGKNIDQFINLKNNKSFIEMIHKSAKSKLQDNLSEVEIEIHDSESKWLNIYYNKLFDEQNTNAELVILFIDVSKYKELDIQKNEFISMTAHELRTPLTAIKGYMSMIIDGDAGALNEKQEKYFSRSYNATERLVNLVEDLLNFLRIEENRVVFKIKPINLKQLTKEVIMDLSQKSYKKQIKLKFSSTIKTDVLVMADTDRTKQIMGNLIDNAIKYTPHGGQIHVKIRKEQQGKNNYLVTEIIDSGVGIPASQIENIFIKFQRINNPLSSQSGGYGLGLFITKSLVEQQGGKLWVKSTPGKGSVFSFSLPAK